MSHLLKIALLTVVGFLGAVLTFIGVQMWSVTERTVTTFFDLTGKKDDGLPMCPEIDWVDKEFLSHRALAAVILFVGIFYLVWAVTQMRKISSACGHPRTNDSQQQPQVSIRTEAS
jgi:hypothetical protein